MYQKIEAEVRARKLSLREFWDRLTDPESLGWLILAALVFGAYLMWGGSRLSFDDPSGIVHNSNGSTGG